jgi:hypothetical protein
MNDSPKHYYSFRIKLEKLNQRTWLLIVLARLLLFLAAIAVRYL